MKAMWHIIGASAAVAIACLAAMFHLSGHAPVGVLPLGVGVALGAVLSGLAGTLRLAGRSRLVIGTVVLAVVTILAQHAWLYVDFRRQWHEARANSVELAIFRPEAPWSPSVYFARELTRERAALWCTDASLIIVAAVGTLLMFRRNYP